MVRLIFWWVTYLSCACSVASSASRFAAFFALRPGRDCRTQPIR
jgi:hypothetical protein